LREGSNEIHKHVAMYKFLNDCIRVLSPKYLGKRSSSNVKSRVTELLYCWSEALPHYVKIKDAYMMLRRNGIIKSDPKYNDRIMMKNIPKIERPSYLDENRELLLKALLSSKSPEDHARANKLIQKLIKEDDEKVEKQAKRIEVLDQAMEASKQLILLVEVVPAGSRGSTMGPMERQKADEAYIACTRLRPTIFRMASDMASEAGDGSSSGQSEHELTNILKANDDLQKAITMFDTNIGEVLMKKGGTQSGSENLLDFSDNGGNAASTPKSSDVLTNSLLDLGLGELVDGAKATAPATATAATAPLSNLDLLMNGVQSTTTTSQTTTPAPTSTTQPSKPDPSYQPSQKYTIEQLSLDAQRAKTIYEKNNLRCISTPCQNKVCLFTFINTSAKRVDGFQLQLSVTKNTKCFIEDPDKTELKEFNPIMPSPGINQIVYFQTPDPSIQVKFRLIFNHGTDSVCETGECCINLSPAVSPNILI